MPKIKKETLKEAIRLAIKRYKVGDSDFVTFLLNQCNYVSKEAFNYDIYNTNFADIILSIAEFKERKNLPITYETFYKVFEIIGFEIVEDETEEIDNANN